MSAGGSGHGVRMPGRPEEMSGGGSGHGVRAPGRPESVSGGGSGHGVRMPGRPEEMSGGGSGHGVRMPGRPEETSAVTLRTADAHQRALVLEAVAALEVAADPIDAARFPALDDPGLRALVGEALGEVGRVLLRLPRGYVSGYDDEIADRLATEGIGVLDPVDRAVLTVVLLRGVAVPRARGRITGDGWTDAEPITVDEIALNRHLTKTQIKTAVRRLRAAGILRPGHRADLVPGPQFERLTPARSQRLWEDLVLVSRPDGMLAEVIRRRRAQPPSPPVHSAAGVPT